MPINSVLIDINGRKSLRSFAFGLSGNLDHQITEKWAWTETLMFQIIEQRL